MTASWTISSVLERLQASSSCSLHKNSFFLFFSFPPYLGRLYVIIVSMSIFRRRMRVYIYIYVCVHTYVHVYSVVGKGKNTYANIDNK